MDKTHDESTADEVTTGKAAGESVWPRRLVWAALLVWLSPAIVAVLIVGGVGIGVGAAARMASRLSSRPWTSRVALNSGRNGVDPAAVVPAAPHLGTVAADVRASRR
jgi:hypothetical protein